MRRLTELQLAVMRALWQRGEATVLDVRESLRPERPLAQSTVATLLTRLEKHGIVDYRTDGRQYVYRPRVSESEVRESAVAELAEGVFEGDIASLVSHLLTAAEVGPEDLSQVREMIDARERALRAETGAGDAGR